MFLPTCAFFKVRHDGWHDGIILSVVFTLDGRTVTAERPIPAEQLRLWLDMKSGVMHVMDFLQRNLIMAAMEKWLTDNQLRTYVKERV